MNLQQFIDYRQYCPMCQTQLETAFHSKRKQVVFTEENQLVVFVLLSGIQQGQKRKEPHTIAYVFDLYHNTFQVDFYSKNKHIRYDVVYDDLRKRFLSLHQNLKLFRFFRECKGCERYRYDSDHFDMDLSTATFQPISLRCEQFGFAHPAQGGHRIYKLLNSYPQNTSDLFFWKGERQEARVCVATPAPWQKATELHLPLIPFVSQEKTLERLANLVIFS